MTGQIAPRCLVLDLDGTLIDSVPDLAAALNRLMAARGRENFSHDEVAAMVGDGARALIERAMAARDMPFDEAALDGFVADYTAHAAEATRLYDGVEATLAAMRGAGWRLAICTNKPCAAAHAVLAALGIDTLFAATGGGDSFPVRKPDPAHLLATLEAAGGVAGRAVMVGDHRNDVMAAIGAGIPCIFAAWGYGTPDMARGAAASAEAFVDIAAIADRLVSA